MEDYNRIYPELPKETPKDKIYPEAPKDGKTFRLQQSCRVLENLEKEAKHYASVRKKHKRCLNVLSRISISTGTLSFCLSGSGVGTAFSGVGIPLAASLGGLGLICGVASVIAGEAGKKVSRKVTKHEKTVSVCESKINSLVKNQHINRNSFVLSQWFWCRNSFFWCWYSPRCVTWRPWSYLRSCECYSRRSR